MPDVCDPLTTLRLEEPSDAVIVTDVALNACQFSVTLCPLLIEPVLAEKVMVGATFFELLAHDRAPDNRYQSPAKNPAKRLVIHC